MYSSNLERHIKSKHEGISYPCDQCDYVAIHKYHLKQHERSKHEGIRYPCDQCDYVATQQSSLNTHKKSQHEGIRYLCDQCDYVATTHSNLITHKQSKHEEIRYPCDQCEYAATYFKNLKRHKQSKHEGIRHPCDQCEYAATNLSDLKKHSKRKHGGQHCDKTTFKANGKHGKVMIEKLDLSKNLKHQNSQNSIETEFVEISYMDVADTEIKIEESVDPLSDPLSTNMHNDSISKEPPNKHKGEVFKPTASPHSDDCELQTKLEIEEDLVIKTEPSDVSEFI